MAKILLMEDDVEFAFDLRSFLEKQGMDVTWCRHVEEARAALEQHSFDLVITDIYVISAGQIVPAGGISLISDIRLSKFLKNRKDISHIPVIAVSAAGQKLGNERILETAKSAGARHCMSKPIDYGELADVMATLLP